MIVRDAVRQLIRMGPLPNSVAAQSQEERIDHLAEILSNIAPPLTDEEAGALVGLFGPDDCYVLAWTMLHLIETAPNWPLESCLTNEHNEWVRRLHDRAG